MTVGKAKDGHNPHAFVVSIGGPDVIVARDPKWFETASEGIQGDRALGLPMLRPAWALADMLRTDGWGKCGLWPDDIDRDQVGERDEADWQAACAAFGLPCTPLHDQAVASR